MDDFKDKGAGRTNSIFFYKNTKNQKKKTVENYIIISLYILLKSPTLFKADRGLFPLLIGQVR